jgi:hypothetical protein
MKIINQDTDLVLYTIITEYLLVEYINREFLADWST